MTSRHNIVVILMSIGSAVWSVGHHQLELWIRWFCKKQAMDLKDVVKDDDSVDTTGSSHFKICRCKSTVCSTQALLEITFATFATIMWIWGSIIHARRVHDAMQIDPTEEYSRTSLHFFAILPPLGLYLSWLIPRFWGMHFAEQKDLGTALQGAVQAVSWVMWGIFGSLQKTKQSQNFCYASTGVLAVLEVILTHTSMKKAKKLEYTITRVVAIIAYYGMLSLFNLGFDEDP